MAVKYHPLFPDGDYNMCFDEAEIERIRRYVNAPENRDRYFWDEHDDERVAIERYIEHEVRPLIRALP